MIKKLITVFCILFATCLVAKAFDEEEITLPAVVAPTLNTTNKAPSEYNYNSTKKSDNDHYDSGEEVFDSKAGKLFSKFVDETVINNKINRTYFNSESTFYEERLYKDIE